MISVILWLYGNSPSAPTLTVPRILDEYDDKFKMSRFWFFPFGTLINFTSKWQRSVSRQRENPAWRNINCVYWYIWKITIWIDPPISTPFRVIWVYVYADGKRGRFDRKYVQVRELGLCSDILHYWMPSIWKDTTHERLNKTIGNC